MAGGGERIDPIEGTWHFEGGQVLVEATGPNTFKGTVVVATAFSNCTHPIGERMWEMTKSGTTYYGTHDGFSDLTTCARELDLATTWTVRQENSRFLLDFCTDYGCITFERAKAPTPSKKINVKPKKVRAGKRVTVYGWARGCPEKILLLSRAFRRGKEEHAGVPGISARIRNAEGYFKIKTRIPRHRRPGKYGISGRCGGGNVGSVKLRVLKRS